MPPTIPISKQVPVVAQVDVLIAGGGIAGCCAAVAAARNGADVMIVERFGRLGGNMGPGMFSGGVVHRSLVNPDGPPEGLKGIPGEFLERCAAYVDGQLGHHYHKDSEVVSYVWLKMMQENNVRLMINSAIADPILEGDRIVGLTFETKSGTQAALAKVVIDATGDADVAHRAGVQTDPGESYSHSGMYFSIADVNEAEYNAHVSGAPTPDPKDLEWADNWAKGMGLRWPSYFNPILPQVKRAWAHGEYHLCRRIGNLAAITLDHGLYFNRQTPGLVGAQVGVKGPHLRCGEVEVMNDLEIGARAYIFETARFFRHHVPGFRHSYLHTTSPYFHARGGRSAVCDYTLTKADVAAGARFDDVVFRAWGSETKEGEFTMEGFDFPYRQLLPKGIEGLLMAGRSAIIQPPVNRTRYKVLLMGQAAGLAAALAVKSGVAPRSVDVRRLQALLHRKYQTYLGDDARLKELALL